MISSFVAQNCSGKQKLLKFARSTKSFLKTSKVARKLPSTICRTRRELQAICVSYFQNIRKMEKIGENV